MADDDLTTGSPPMDGVVVAPQAAVSAQPPTADVDVLEPQDQAAAAREARETVARLPRQRAAPPKPASTETKTVQPGQNPFDAFDGDPDDNGIALAERNRLNKQDAFYRGSLAGSIRLSSLANLYNTPDPDGITPEQRAVNKQMREEYESIVSDLAAYDQMPSFGTTMEALVSLGGQLEGTMISPESWVGWAAKGATWGARTLRAGLQQGAISGAVDPAIQGLNIQAGVEKEYDPLRTAVAAATGLGIGATAHSLGEGLGHVVGQKMLRRQIADLAAEDAAFKNVRTAQELLNPESGVARPEPIVAREAPEPESVAPPVREYEPGPVEGFDDVVKAERERLSNSYGAAQPRAKRLNEEARFSAFEREAGTDLDMVLETHALRREDVGDLYDFYDRRPGENPKAALERAIDQWADARERAALQSLEMDSEWVREMDVLMTAMENEPPIGAGTYRTFRGEDIPLDEFPRSSPTREVQQEVPFRGASEETAAGGRSTEPGGGAPSRQEAGDTGGREGAADGGRRGGTGTVAAEGPRGERLGGPQETLGVTPREGIRFVAKNFREEFPRLNKAANEDSRVHLDEAIEDEQFANSYVGSATYARSTPQYKDYLENGRSDDGYLVKRLHGDSPIGWWIAFDEWSRRLESLPNIAPDKLGTLLRQAQHTEDMLKPGGKYADDAVPPKGTARAAFDREQKQARQHYNDLREQLGLRPIGEGFDDPSWGWRFLGDETQPAYKTMLVEDVVDLMLVHEKMVDAPDSSFRLETDAQIAERVKREESGAGAQPKTERTAQGEQTLIPGVAPITDRQRAEAGMTKPMRGGDAPAGGLFDEGARNQQDLFLARRRSGSTLEGEQVRPAEGIAQPEVPSPAADVAIRSLQQQSLDLAKALDFPLRQGRVGSRNAEGVFRPRSGVVRVREVPDFEVVAHEGAHALEAKMGPDLTALTEAFPDELARLDYDQGPTGRRVNEGFAEWMRLYMGNPAAMEKQAPGFTTAFRAFMQERRPDLMQAIDGAAASYRAYLDAPSVDAVGAVRRSVDEEPRGFRKVIASLKEDGFGAVVKSVMQRSYDAVLDDKAPITRAVRELGRIISNQTGSPLDLKSADNPAVLIRMLARSRQAAVRDMMDGVRPYGEITPEGPSLANAISEAIGAPSVWGKWDDARKGDFSKYLIARRAEYLWRKFDAGELANPPVAFSAADARMAMADMEAANPNFRNASDMVHGYTRELLRKQYEGGLITRDLYDKLLTEEFYVPFNRDMVDKPAAGGGGAGAEGPGTTETVKRMRGSSRDIKDPLESLMMQTFLVNRTIRHNDIIKSFVDLARKAGPEGGKYVEPIPAHEARKYTVNIGELLENKAREIGMDPDDARVLVAAMGDVSHEDPVMGSFFKMERASGRGEPIVFYKEGGELRAARFMSEKEGHALYEVLTAAPEVVTDLYKQVIGTGASVLRAGITTSPTFVVSNYIRDQFAAAILRSDYIPIISGLKGLKSEAQQGEAAILYGYAGGVSGGAATGPVERAAERDLDALAKRGFRLQRTTSFKGLLELASFTEAGTRNSIFDTVFQTKMAQGLSKYEAMIEAAFQAQDLLDFSRHGSRTMAVRNMIPFLNATLQGLDKANRTMIEPIIDRVIRASRGEGPAFVQDSADFKNAVNAWVKAGALGGALGAVWAAVSWDREAYRDAPPRVKGTHLIVPWGDRYIVVPKPFELGLGFTFGEYAFQQMMTDDPRAARQFMEAAWEVLAPPNPLTHTPVITPTIELTLGKSLFTGRDIVPDQYKGLPDEMQYTDRTSELAKWLGKQTGLSPIKIEYGIGANFGTWGRDVAALSQGLNEDAPAASFDDAAFLRRFIKDPTRSSEVSTKFWEFMARSTGKFNQAVTAYDSLVKGFRDDQAREFLAKLPDAQKAFVTLKSAADEDGKPAFSPDEKRLHPLQRAYDAVTLLNGIRKELATNTHTGFENGDLRKMDAVTRRDLLENIRELSQMELRNGLKIAEEPGYATRPLLDPNEVMERIRHISPEVAEEIARRYATSKIPKTAEVAKAWPRAQRELLRFGSGADIKGLSYDVKVAGPEFEGDKVKRPLKRRVPIVGSPAAAPNP